MKEFKVLKPATLREFTDCVYPQGAFYLARLLEEKGIKVNGARVKADLPLKAGDIVTYYTTPKQEAKQSHFPVYEDGNIYIADKLSGVTYEGLLSELSQKGEFYGVHRLDRNTCGLIVFAKTKGAEAALLSAFKERKVHKIYRAVCKNAFKRDAELLMAYHFKGENSTVKISDTERAGYKKIITEYRVLKREGDLAEVEINLHTGRTHQIRAHLAHIGCPVLGDGKYGDASLNKKYHLTRQQLVAKFLSFDQIEGMEYLKNLQFKSAFEANIPK